MSNEVNQRLQRVINNIKSQTAFNNQYSQPKTLAERMAELHTPAVSLAIIDDYEVTAVGSFGFGESGDTTPVTQDSLFLAGSISKPVFAAAVMVLVQQGQIDLDEDINHYLSSWKIPQSNGWQPRITLRQLLSHTSGLTVHGFPGYQTTEAIPTIQQILNGERPSNTPKVEANILPGMQFRYSGGGTTVAQLAIIDHLKEPFPALMKRLVFEPLGMHNSTFDNPLLSTALSMATVAHPWKGIPLKGGHHIYPEMAAAGLWSTATDLATFGIALQNGLRGEEATFLNKASLDAMLSPQLAQDKDASDFVSLGFFCGGKDQNAFFRHGGWDEGFVAELVLSRHLGRGVVVMINSNEGHPLLAEILDAVAEEFNWPRSDEKKTVVQLPDLDAYTGHFETAHSHQFNIETATGGLHLKYDAQLPVFFEASSETSFFSRELNTELNFKRNDDGQVTAVSVKQANARFEATKRELRGQQFK